MVGFFFTCEFSISSMELNSQMKWVIKSIGISQSVGRVRIRTFPVFLFVRDIWNWKESQELTDKAGAGTQKDAGIEIEENDRKPPWHLPLPALTTLSCCSNATRFPKERKGNIQAQWQWE